MKTRSENCERKSAVFEGPEVVEQIIQRCTDETITGRIIPDEFQYISRLRSFAKFVKTDVADPTFLN